MKTNSNNECGLFLTQLANILMHLQNSGISNISLDEIFICKRETLVQPKLLVLPFNVDAVSAAINVRLCFLLTKFFHIFILSSFRKSDVP